MNSALITPSEIQNLILASLPGARVSVQDMRGTGDHFEIEVVSQAFAGKPLIEQHKMVFAALEKEMDDRIHAVQLKTRVK
jgi:stress-induced morphogen